jgi:hypothetical protein
MRHLLSALLLATVTLATSTSLAEPPSRPATKVSPAFLLAFGGLTVAASSLAVRLAVFSARNGDVHVGSVSFGASPLWYLPGAGGTIYGLGTVVAGAALPESGDAVLPGLAVLALGAAEAAGIAAMIAGFTMKRNDGAAQTSSIRRSLQLRPTTMACGGAVVVSGRW